MMTYLKFGSKREVGKPVEMTFVPSKKVGMGGHSIKGSLSLLVTKTVNIRTIAERLILNSIIIL